MRPVFKLPAYCRLLAAYTLTQLAWWVGTLALAVLVYRRTGSALASAAFFLCAQFVPALLSPALVARIDQRAVGRVLPELYAAEAVAFAALAWVSSHFFLGTLLIIVILDGVIALAGRALIRAATVAVTSPAGLLREGNALINGAFSICFFVGPVLGAVVADAEGTDAALLLAAAMFAVIALILATGRGLPPAMAEDRPKAGRLRARSTGPERTLRSARCWGCRPRLWCSSRSRFRLRWCLPSTRSARAGAATPHCCPSGAPAPCSEARSTRAGARFPAGQ